MKEGMGRQEDVKMLSVPRRSMDSMCSSGMMLLSPDTVCDTGGSAGLPLGAGEPGLHVLSEPGLPRG